MITNEDNMELMARYEDKHFDLAIVDPPYGISIGKQSLGEGGGLYRKPKKYKRGDWDNEVPKNDYWEELFRVSKNQIIWGGNYFDLAPTPCFLFWDKNNGGSDFADGELAWTSFKSPVRKYKYTWSGFVQQRMGAKKEARIHPTQKPVALYEWLLKNYAKEGDKILDTHLGSGSIAIAVDRMNKIEGMNLTLTACELDEDYYKAAMKRINEQTSQTAIPL